MADRFEQYTMSTFHRAASGPTKFNFAYRDDWFGGISRATALDRCLTGDTSLVAEAERLMDQLTNDLNVESTVPAWIGAPCGAYPIVPEYLANEPMCMRMRGPVPVSAPVRVFASIWASASIDPDDIRKRGAAIMALVLKLQQVRPVELFLVMPWSQPNALLSVEIESKPLDISVAAFALVHPAFFRALGHSVLKKHEDRGTLANENWNSIKTTLGVTDQDIFIKSIVHGDPLVKSPIEWINGEITRLNGE